MNEDLRALLDRLEQRGVLRRVKRAVDPRHFSTLCEQAGGPLFFEHVMGYDTPVVGNLVGNRRCLTEGLQVRDAELGQRLIEAVDHPIAPVVVDSGPCKEVVLTGDAVDLTMFPIPLESEKDGGPYVAGGIVVARDPELGRNAGFYRMMYRTPTELCMGVFNHSDMLYYYRRAYEERRPLEVAVVIGAHLAEQVAASYQAPIDMDEFTIAGGLRGEPLEMVRCETVDLEVPAHAEVILEGQVLPEGWIADEGRFGEFTRSMGGVLRLPLFRVTAITTRRTPIFHALHMPWENVWLNAARLEGTALRALRLARIDVRALSVTAGGCGGILVVAIHKRAPGDAKDAIHVLLSSVRLLKLVIVVDEDVDVYDPMDVDTALAFRMQPDRDLVVVEDVRGSNLDLSTRPWEVKPGELVTTSKLGIDATIPDRVPRSRFEKLRPAFHEDVRLDDYL